MQPKSKFLVKTVCISLGLFALWGPASKIYGGLLALGLKLFNPMYAYIMKEAWLYKNSLFLIPLISLALATPNVKIIRKLAIMGIGLLLLISIDSVRIRFEIGDSGPSALYAVYHTLKLLLPFILWLVMLSPDFFSIFDRQEFEDDMYSIACPLCGVQQHNIMEHIHDVHGNRSLRFKKVRKFIAKYPHLAWK